MVEPRKTTKETILECPECNGKNRVPPGAMCAGGWECANCLNEFCYLIEEDGKPAEPLTRAMKCRHGNFTSKNRCRECHPLPWPDIAELSDASKAQKNFEIKTRFWIEQIGRWVKFLIAFGSIGASDYLRHKWAGDYGGLSADSIVGQCLFIAAIFWAGHIFYNELSGRKEP